MIKVIGIGNRLMMDDGVAVAVLENIGEHLINKDVEVIIGESNSLYCFHQLKDNDYVIILDAAYTGVEAGSLHTYNLHEAIKEYGETSSQHDMNLFDLLRLYSKPIKGYFIGIEVAEIKLGDELSEVLKTKFNDICSNVEKKIIEIIGGITNA